MILHGIDLDGLAELAPQKPQAIPVVPGRQVHIDADFLAYQCSYEKAGEPKTLDDMKHNLVEAVEFLRGMAGAEKAVLHITPKESNKGGRRELAVQKEYQANREGKEKPRYLHLIRAHMAEALGAIPHLDQEADDGMAQANWAAIAAGKRELSIIATKDKDLNMVPGLHLDWSTGAIVDADAFGSIVIGDKGKLTGFGSKFFWAQLLMGDTADNIQGLPYIAPSILNRVMPTAAVTKAMERLQSNPLDAAAAAILSDTKPKACGPASTMKLLGKMKNDAQCYKLVKLLYEQIEKWGFEFTHWDGQSKVPWNHALRSEMQLLWMRRRPDPNDVFYWVKEVTA